MDEKRLIICAAVGIGAVFCYFFKSERNKSHDIGKNINVTTKKENLLKSIKENDANIISVEQAKFLNSMLASHDQNTVNDALITIGNMSAFTDNQVIFRECKCLQTVVSFIADQSKKMNSGLPVRSSEIMNNALICVNNLCLNEENQFIIKDIIPAIIHILVASSFHTVKQNAMMVLTNFSIISAHNHVFNEFIPVLVKQIFVEDQDTMQMSSHRLSALKILINLSADEMTCKIILECKIPSFLYFAPITHPLFQGADILLRWLTLLSNLSNECLKEGSQSNGFTSNKTASLCDREIYFENLFLDESCRTAMKQDLKNFLDRHLHRNDTKELCDIVAYIEAKLTAIKKPKQMCFSSNETLTD